MVLNVSTVFAAMEALLRVTPAERKTGQTTSATGWASALAPRILVRSHVRYAPTLVVGRTTVPSGGDLVANRRSTAAPPTRGATEDGRQLSFVVREPQAAPPNHAPKLALHIPPPRSPVSAVRRLDLAARWAADLGELAAELVAEGKLEVEGRPAAKPKERTP